MAILNTDMELPVMVCDDGGKSANADPVAHQMNFFTQEILHPVKNKHIN